MLHLALRLRPNGSHVCCSCGAINAQWLRVYDGDKLLGFFRAYNEKIQIIINDLKIISPARRKRLKLAPLELPNGLAGGHYRQVSKKKVIITSLYIYLSTVELRPLKEFPIVPIDIFALQCMVAR